MTASQKTKNLFRNYSIAVGLLFAYFILIGLLSEIFPGLDTSGLQDSRLQRLIAEDPLQLFILAVVVAPILEEGLFRTLIKPKTWELSFFCSGWIVFMSLQFIPQDVYWALKYAIAILVLFILYKSFREVLTEAKTQKLRGFLSKFYSPVIIITSILFGLMHVGNYVAYFTLSLPLLVAIFPRVILGAMFAKVKLENNNLYWAMLMHGLNNGIVILIGFLTYEPAVI